jgi:mono/diheme cytochrome c family protein
MRRPPPNGRVLVFKLGGSAKLPALPAASPRPYVHSTEKFTAAQVAEGEAQYLAFCSICHTGPVNPDLFRSPVAGSKAAWNAVVIGGALKDRGMISFAPWISPAQAEAVRAYVISEAGKRTPPT